MAQRKLQEVDASSIADIAFILFAFIIVVTTLQKQVGMPEFLPPVNDATPPPPVPKLDRNVLEILINKDNQLMIEGEWIDGEPDESVKQIPAFVTSFMNNTTDDGELPVMDDITKVVCLTKIAQYEPGAKSGTQSAVKELKRWKKRLRAVELLGPFKTINEFAVIAMQYDLETESGVGLKVRDHIMKGINQLRDELSNEKFGRTYKELISIREEIKTDLEKDQIRAIREVYPQRIAKLPPRRV